MKYILIIDREPFSRSFLNDNLDGDYHVFAAASGTEAIVLAQHQPLDMILLDIDMPEGNGAEICSLLKENIATKYIPLILLSSCSQKEDIINGLHAGADDYVTKPICGSEFLARIDTHLRTKDYYADLEKEDLLMLLELSETISVTRNPRRILTIIIEKMVATIDVSRCSIIALNDSGELIVKASSDLPDNREIKIDLEKYPEIKKALTTQRPVVVQDIRKDPLMASVRDKIQGLSDHALFVMPIIKKQNVIGTFFLRTASPIKEWVSPRIFKLCQLVANISGNALENAVIFEAMHSQRKLLEELAFRDNLTGLCNHQQFHTRLEEEFSRAQRYAMPLSCVFADIDYFKHINDCYGHITGDVVLKQTGKLIAKILRKSDVAARYGGDEFAILLPNTTRRGAGNLAKRLEKKIGELSIKQLKGKRVSISVGVSTYNGENALSCQDLLHHADEAMYAAKQAKKENLQAMTPGS
jgi:two-component system cell cycle response regulator